MNLQLLISGVSMGIVYGLIAMGMVLIFRSVGIMNFAQGGKGIEKPCFQNHCISHRRQHQ